MCHWEKKEEKLDVFDIKHSPRMSCKCSIFVVLQTDWTIITTAFLKRKSQGFSIHLSYKRKASNLACMLKSFGNTL